MQAYLFNQQDIRSACLDTLTYATNHSTAAICWKNIERNRELPKYRAITRAVEKLTSSSESVPAAEDDRPPAVSWFQVSRITRQRPWGLELYCPTCSKPPQNDSSNLDQPSEYTLHASTRDGYTLLTCERCWKVAVIRRPEFWMFEHGVNSLMEFPQPEVHLQWEGKEERNRRLKANTRGDGSKQGKKRQRPLVD